VHHVLGTEDQGVVDAHSTRYDSMRDQVVAFPRTAQLLTACAERGLGVVLATSGAPADLSWMRPAIGAEDAVLGVTTSGDVESAKPAPDLLTTAVHAHHLDPARVVVVGDTVWDIEAARAAGLSCIALTCGGIPAPVQLGLAAVATGVVLTFTARRPVRSSGCLLSGVEVRRLEVAVDGLGAHAKAPADAHSGQLATVHQPVDRHLGHAHHRRHLGDGEEIGCGQLGLTVFGLRRHVGPPARVAPPVFPTDGTDTHVLL